MLVYTALVIHNDNQEEDLVKDWNGYGAGTLVDSQTKELAREYMSVK